MQKCFIGLISGTSVDGVDAVLVDNDIKLLTRHYLPYPALLKAQLKSINKTLHIDFAQLAELDWQIATLFSQSVLELLDKTNKTANDICAIGSHGQTIYHAPKYYSLQIGHPALIAEQTKISVIADFRMSDVAAGGEGAPLAPIFHHYLLQKQSGNVVNLGGIANITTIKNNDFSGFDSGPANTLIDAWCQQHTGSPYDDKGAWAKSGKLDKNLLKKLISDPYFFQSAPKSTGVEYFNLVWLKQHLTGNENAQDVARTLVELSAQTIANGIDKTLNVWLSGGGVHNDFLVSRIKALAHPVAVESVAALGIDPDYVEACAFAYFAKQTLAGAPMITNTHQNGARILGGIYHY